MDPIRTPAQLWAALPRDMKGCVWWYTQALYAPVPPPSKDFFWWAWQNERGTITGRNDFMPTFKGNLCDVCYQKQITVVVELRNEKLPPIFYFCCNFCLYELVEDELWYQMRDCDSDGDWYTIKKPL